MSLLPFQAPAAFESAAADFSAQGWENLEEWQRELYQNVLRGKNESLSSLGRYHSISYCHFPTSSVLGTFSRTGICRNVEKSVPVAEGSAAHRLQSFHLQRLPGLASGHSHLRVTARGPLPSARGVFPRWGGVGCQRRNPPSPRGPCRGLSVLPRGGLWPMETVWEAQLSVFLPADTAGILMRRGVMV